jgi:Phage tail lysozyme
VEPFNVDEVAARRWLDLTPAPKGIGGLDTRILRQKGVEAGRGDELFIQKAPGVMKDLIRDFRDLTAEQAAAILGNIGHECGGFHELHQQGVADRQGGYGWCQWDGGRRDEFLNFAGDNWISDDVNYSFLTQELRGSEKKHFEAMKQENTLEGAVIVFDKLFERSGKPNLPSRLRYAQLALEAYKNSLV